MARWMAGMFLALAAALLGNVVAPPAARAQETATVHGRVVAVDGAAAGSVQVVAVHAPSGAHYGNVADATGHYRIGGLAPGRYRIEVRAVGQQPRTPVTITLAAGELRVVDIALQTAPVPLEGVEVTAVGRDRFEESYAATRMEAEVDGATARTFNPANTYDALRLVPGVTYSSGNRFGKPARIRGASSWTTADVIEDFPSVREAGIGAEDGGFTADFGSTIPSIALAGVEVKKGSLGVLYGGGADGGVIVNQLRRGTPGGTLGGSIETSPMGETLYMADFGAAAESFDIYAAGKLLHGNYRDFVDERGRALAADDLTSGLVRAGWQPFSSGRLEVIGIVGEDRIRYSLPRRDDAATEIDESRALAPDLFRTTNRSGFYGATFDHAVSSDLGYEVGYSLFRQRAVRFSISEDRAHRDRPETSHTGFGNVYWNESLTQALDANLKAGFEWAHHRQAEEAQESEKMQTFQDRSAFLAGTLVLDEALTLSGGGRYIVADGEYRGKQSFWVHDLGAAYDFRPTGTRLIASRSTGYSRFKGFAYFFGDVEAAGGYDVARTATLEGSVEQRIPSPWGNGRFTATVFRLETDGIPIFAGSGAGGIITQDTEANGLELSADFPLGALEVAGSFSWQDAEVVATDHPEGLNVGSTAGWIPQYSAALAVAATPFPALDLSLMATYDDGRRRQTLEPLTDDISVATSHAFTRVNAAASWRLLPSVSLRLRLENILDEKDLGYSVQTVAADGSLTTTESVAVDPGRILFVGFDIRSR